MSIYSISKNFANSQIIFLFPQKYHISAMSSIFIVNLSDKLSYRSDFDVETHLDWYKDKIIGPMNNENEKLKQFLA